jgi:hypothetical protein
MPFVQICGRAGLILAILAFSASFNAAEATLIRLTAQLSGEAEVPGPGDPDGSGSAAVVFDDVASTIDWNITVADIGPVILDHIHSAPIGVPGPVVIDFAGALSGADLAVDPTLLSNIVTNPELFYVNVHTPEFPAGAIRGQLSAAAVSVPEPAMAGMMGLALAAMMLAARRRSMGRPADLR